MAKNKQTEKDLTVNEKQAQVIREALEKRTQKEGVDKNWFDRHVIVEVV